MMQNAADIVDAIASGFSDGATVAIKISGEDWINLISHAAVAHSGGVFDIKSGGVSYTIPEDHLVAVRVIRGIENQMGIERP